MNKILSAVKHIGEKMQTGKKIRFMVKKERLKALLVNIQINVQLSVKVVVEKKMDSDYNVNAKKRKKLWGDIK